MVEETKQRKNVTSLQAGPGEADHSARYNINMSRVSQRIGRQLAMIGDELDYKWREQLALQWQPMNFGIYPYVLTRRAFSGIFTNVWGTKIMPMLRTSWLLQQLQNGCQEAKKWAALVSNLQVSDWSRCILASAFLLFTVSIFLITWNENEG